MADYGAAIYTMLTTEATITAIVGTRVFPWRAGQMDTMPFLVYQLGDSPEESKDENIEILNVRMNLVSIADTSDGAFALAEVCKDFLKRKRITTGGVEFDKFNYMGSEEYFEDSSGVFQVSQQYDIRIKP